MKCPKCSKTVYKIEGTTIDSLTYHKRCFRCDECNLKLTLNSFRKIPGIDDKVYCLQHYKGHFTPRSQRDKTEAVSPEQESEGKRDTEDISGEEIATEEVVTEEKVDQTGHIFHSIYPDEVLLESTLTHVIFKDVERFGDRIAMIDASTDRRITYPELEESIRKCASGLIDAGLRHQEVVAVHLPNCIEYGIIFHAVLSVGATLTTLNPLCTPRELSHQIKDASPKMMITSEQFLKNATEAIDMCPVVEKVFVVGITDATNGALPFDSLLENDGSSYSESIDIRPKEDLCVIPYSSGTSGLPKGVMLTHYSFVNNIIQSNKLLEVTEGERILALLPMFHIYGMFMFLNMAFAHGATLVIMNRFIPDQFLKTLEKYEVFRAYLVPPIVLFLAKSPLVDQYDLSKLQYILSAAAPLSNELAEVCVARLNCGILQGYGMTELSPVAAIAPKGSKKYGSCGRLVPNTQAKLIDVNDGHLCGHNENGEICIRGPQSMKGYLNNRDATSKIIDEDGFLHTGDIGYVDDDGDIFIVDRAKELIKYKGFQVPPAELEGLLQSHESIADAAVIGVANEEAGEIPKAFIVLKSNQELSAEEVMAYVAKQVAPYKKVREVEFIDKIPKSASGKILRRILKDKETAKNSS